MAGRPRFPRSHCAKRVGSYFLGRPISDSFASACQACVWPCVPRAPCGAVRTRYGPVVASRLARRCRPDSGPLERGVAMSVGILCNETFTITFVVFFLYA